MSQTKLKTFLSNPTIENTYKKAITSQSKAFDLKPRELLKIHPEGIIQLHQQVLDKKKQVDNDTDEWLQSQKKLLDWLILVYLHLHSKTVSQMDDRDYYFLSQIMSKKSIGLIKYHIQSMLKRTKRPKWSEKEDRILYQILAVQKKYSTVGEWSHVSKDLFLRGDQQTYKSGKNCRERWYNHVDPCINKTWTPEEDLILLQYIKKHGKKWSSVISQLDGRKSEHMIKNRYNSLLKKKTNQQNMDENRAIDQLIKQKIQQTQDTKKEVKTNKQEQRRVLRSSSIKIEEKEEPKIDILKSHGSFNFSNFVNVSNLLEDDHFKTDGFKFIDMIREDPAPEEIKPKQFNPYESLKFSISSPLPVTPAPNGLLSSQNNSFQLDKEYNFGSCFQSFKSVLKE